MFRLKGQVDNCFDRCFRHDLIHLIRIKLSKILFKFFLFEVLSILFILF